MTASLFVNRYTLSLLLASLLSVSADSHAELTDDCDALAAMGARFYAVKTSGQELDRVLSVIQKASAGSPEKEALLTNVAIDIYIDPSVTNTQTARRSAVKGCQR